MSRNSARPRAPPRTCYRNVMARRLRLAVIGCGGRGMGYVKLLGGAEPPFEDAELYAVCDPHEATRDGVGVEFGVEPAHRHASVQDLLEGDGVALDGVVIATPAHLNQICALPCIKAGLHVMMEKPPGLSVAETSALRDAAVASGSKVMVAWNRRFHPLIVRARELVLQQGPITQVLGEFHKDMRSFVNKEIAGANMSTGRGGLPGVAYRKREWWDGTKWTQGFPPSILDKMFMESPVHALDVVRSMGGDVAETHAFSDRVFTDYRDVHSVMMRHEGGCISTVIANYTQPTGHRLERYEIHGHGITAHLCLPDPVTGKDTAWVRRDNGMDRTEVLDFSGDVGAGNGGTTEQLRYFADAVLNDTPIGLPAANLDEALKTMAVAAATLSAGGSGSLRQAISQEIDAAELQAKNAWRKLDAAAETEVVVAEAAKL